MIGVLTSATPATNCAYVVRNRRPLSNFAPVGVAAQRQQRAAFEELGRAGAQQRNLPMPRPRSDQLLRRRFPGSSILCRACTASLWTRTRRKGAANLRRGHWDRRDVRPGGHRVANRRNRRGRVSGSKRRNCAPPKSITARQRVCRSAGGVLSKSCAVTPSRRCPRRRPWPRTRCNID